MKTPIDNSTKKVFRNARIRSYGKARACINYDNAKVFKSNPAAIMLIRRKYPIKEILLKELLV